MRVRWLLLLLLWTSSTCLAASSTAGWQSGYETWPAPEWFVWEGSNYRARDESASGSHGWTVICGSGDAREGNCAMKAWVNTAYCNGSSCRAYPGMHAEIPMPLIDVFWIRIDELEFAGNGWFSILTHANVNWAVNTMSLVGAPGREWHLEMAHLPHRRVGNPGPVFQRGQWHRVTSYLNWRPSGDGTVMVWIDGVKTFEGTSTLEGTLPRAHYGAYTSNVRRAVLWNDGHRICPLPGPLTDLATEPRCPGGTRPRPPVLED